MSEMPKCGICGTPYESKDGLVCYPVCKCGKKECAISYIAMLSVRANDRTLSKHIRSQVSKELEEAKLRLAGGQK